MYILETEIFYGDSYKDKELFNTSNYLKESKYYDHLNTLLVGKMNDKKCGVPIKGFAGLIFKMYTFETEHNH